MANFKILSADEAEKLLSKVSYRLKYEQTIKTDVCLQKGFSDTRLL